MHGFEGFADFFSAFGGSAETFDCTIDIYEGDNHRTAQLSQPRMFIESQFAQLMQQASQTGSPVKIKLSRTDKFWNQLEQAFENREHFVIFSNNAWRDLHREEEME